MSFDVFGLAQPIVRAVSAAGYTTPTPIQAQAIPHAMEGRDVLGCAQTGTGKTCAFALPILHRLMPQPRDGQNMNGRKPLPGARAPRALILAPTRELASQILDSFDEYGRGLPLRHTAIFGGVSQHKQVQSLRGGVDIVVATPGRLLDLIEQGYVDLRSIETLVLDEADRMLDMGFINDIRRIVALLPADRQTLLFSATLSSDIKGLVATMQRDPIHISTSPESTTAQSVAQHVYMVERAHKAMLLDHLLRDESVKRTLVFTRTKHGADRLVKFLLAGNIAAEAIHGNKSQNARTRTMQAFRNGQTRVLVATDIAARGIDVDGITHVINFDMPVDAETYVHRIGRTARAGAAGIAIAFCDRDERGILHSIERRTQIKLAVIRELPDFTALAAERQQRRASLGLTADTPPVERAPRPREEIQRSRSKPAQRTPQRRDNAENSNRPQRPAKPERKIGAEQRTRRRKPHRGQSNAARSA